ncbi:hypothetical protein HDU78_000164 [Chytriomyces hyalinus]|nr:hypothetical protein HDU78_000164 [Chytriomyces hyalinus]
MYSEDEDSENNNRSEHDRGESEDDESAAELIMSFSKSADAQGAVDAVCVHCGVILHHQYMVKTKVSPHLMAYLAIKEKSCPSLDSAVAMCKMPPRRECYKGYEKWKKTAAGKAAVKAVIATLARNEKKARTIQECDETDDEDIQPHAKKDKKDSDVKSREMSPQIVAVKIRVALHSPSNLKGVFEVLKVTEVLLPDSIDSLTALRYHLEDELEAWAPSEWVDAIYYQAGIKKAELAVMNILNFKRYESILHSIVKQKQTPVIVLKQRKSEAKGSGHGTRIGGGGRNDRAEEYAANSKRLEALVMGHCNINKSGCFHKTIKGVPMHLKLSMPMIAHWARQINAGSPGVSFTCPPDLAAFDDPNFTDANGRTPAKALDNIPTAPFSSFAQNLQNQQPPQFSNQHFFQTPATRFYSNPGPQQHYANSPTTPVQQHYMNSPTTPTVQPRHPMHIVQPAQTPPNAQTSLQAHSIQPMPRNTIRFFRELNGAFHALTGTIPYSDSDTLITVMEMARLPTAKKGKILTAWDKKRSGMQVMFGLEISRSFESGNAEVIIRSIDEVDIEY